MGQPTLVELIAKQQSGDLSESEQKLLNQKLLNLDKVANQQDSIGLQPTGNRTYGQYNFYVDWANDGNFTGAYDDLSSRFISADIMRGLAGENAYCALPAQIEIQLDNTDQYLSSDNLNSPISAYILGSTKKRCRFDIVSQGTTYRQFEGWVREIAANPSTHGRRMATIVVDDLLGRMKSDPLIATMRTNATETSLLAEAMAGMYTSAYGACYYGAAFYGGSGVYGLLQAFTQSFDTATDSFAYAGDTWKEAETSNLDAVQDIMRSCLGQFFVDRTGVPVYKARTYRATNATTSDWDASAVTRVDAVGLQDETLFNEVQLIIRQRKPGTVASVLWTLRDTPAINAGATVTYVCGFTEAATGLPCGAINPVTPVQGTDYTNNTNLQVSVFWRAADALVQIKNNSAGPITLDLLQLRGTPITSPDKTLFKHTGSVAPKKTKWHDAPLLSNTINASSYTDWLYTTLSMYTDKARQVTITPVCAADLTQVAQLDVNRRITLPDGTIGYVNWVHHSIQSGSHIVTCGLSPAVSTVMWVLGTSQLDTTTALGV